MYPLSATHRKAPASVLVDQFEVPLLYSRREERFLRNQPAKPLLASSLERDSPMARFTGSFCLLDELYLDLTADATREGLLERTLSLGIFQAVDRRRTRRQSDLDHPVTDRAHLGGPKNQAEPAGSMHSLLDQGSPCPSHTR